jgi:hypothetical protein
VVGDSIIFPHFSIIACYFLEIRMGLMVKEIVFDVER